VFADVGSATAITIAAVTVVAILGAAAVTGAAVAVTAAQAQGAADAAAIAAAHDARDARALGSLDNDAACDVARTVVSANGAAMAQCTVTPPGIVRVEVRHAVSGWLGTLRVARTAVAGPSDVQR
jgi:secretion/DNA translocation related TadE-like protein